MEKTFKELLASGEFLAVASIDPPKGVDLGNLGNLVDRLKPQVEVLGLSDNHNGVMSMSPWGACKEALDRGMETLMHMACRDRNRLALQSDLLAAASLGITNILCVTGDHVKFGDHIHAKGVFDIDSVHLISAARALEDGEDMAGNRLESVPSFFLGAVANPEAEPIEPQLMKVDKKIKAGASFLITHPVFSVETLKRLVDHVRERDVGVLAGVRLLDPEEVPKYRDGDCPGLFVPESLLDRLDGASGEEAIKAAAEMVQQIKNANLCNGVHIAAPGHEDKIPDILKAAGI
jgi:5,10-methylenetetrahydrofolate reductase